jgi:hypothetical protein
VSFGYLCFLDMSVFRASVSFGYLCFRICVLRVSVSFGRQCLSGIEITTTRCVITQKSVGLIYLMAEACFTNKKYS